MSQDASESQPPPSPPSSQSGLFGVGLMVLVAIALGIAIFFWPESTSKTLENLRVAPLDGDSPAVTLADLRGKVALVNLWGTWCPPCLSEYPHMVDIYKKFKNRDDFRLLAISCGPPGSGEDIQTLRQNTQAFLDQNDSPMPAYTDQDQVTRRAIDQAVGLQGYPTTILLDRHSTIRRVWVGYTPGAEQEMDAAISDLLDQ